MEQMPTGLGIGGSSPTPGVLGPQGALFSVFRGWDKEKAPKRAMLVLIVYTVVTSLLVAASKPLWYDELCTVAVAGQPTLTALWRALHQTRDSNPPFYCFVAYFFRHAVVTQEIAYRLPSILGFVCALWCVFVFVRKRSGGVLALLCASVLMLTPLYRPYAVEARPYSLLIAFIAIAMVCYQRAPSIWAMLLMGLSLAAAEASHYYALFAFVPFGAAEAVYFAKTKRLRWSVWLSLVVGVVPLALMWPRLRELQRFYGLHFWSQPNWLVPADSYAQLFRMPAAPALGIAAGLCLMFLWDSIAADCNRAAESILAAGFLALPLIAYAGATLAHGGLTGRYSLPAVLGLPLSVKYVLSAVRRKGVLLFAVVLFTAIGLQEIFFWQGERGHLGKFESPVASVETLLSSARHSDLPIVVSNGVAYVQFAHYASPQVAERLVGLVDAPQALIYAGTDSLDLQMSALQCCLPLRVQGFNVFAAVHQEFLLYSDEEQWDWWPARLARDGYDLRLLVADRNRKMYLVNRKQ
jgi:uncharacterized membrane protein